METTITTSPPTNEAEAEAMFASILEQVQKLREQMKAHDAEIARLKAETAEPRTETRAILARLQGQATMA
jgi:NifB/MoaA-like Fe-S oxidoreductase